MVGDDKRLYQREWMRDLRARERADRQVKTFDMDVLVSVRHPLGFVSSLVRMGWFFDYSDLLAQELLMSTLLRESRADIEQAAASHDDPVLNAAVAWKVLHRVIAWDAVGEVEGAGIVHIAPGCGKEDFLLGKEPLGR